MFTPRSDVYKAIDTERGYQDAKWGSTESAGLHSITEFLVFIRDYTEEALHAESRESMKTADPKASGYRAKDCWLGCGLYGTAWRTRTQYWTFGEGNCSRIR
jgi:hypothetical protein